MSNVNADFERRLKAVRRLGAANSVASYLVAAQKIAADYPRRATAQLELGIAFIEVARYDDARKAIERSSSLCKPESVYFPYFWKGHLYREQGNLRLAEKWLRRSINSNPNYPEAWAFLGAVLAKQGRFSEAKSSWRKLIKLGTGATEEGYFNLGLIFRAEQEYRKSLECGVKALAIDPKYMDAKRLVKDIREVLRDDA